MATAGTNNGRGHSSPQAEPLMVAHYEEEDMQQNCDGDLHIDSVLWESYLKRGRVALEMKMPSEAARMFEIALQKTSGFGSDDWRTMDTQRQLAMSLVEAKEWIKAETTLTNLLHMLFSKFGSTSPEVLEAMRLLGTVYEQRMLYSDAAKIMKYVLTNHPHRHSDNADYKFVERKFYALQSKARALNEDDTVNWIG
jgi:hypothetical protein